MCGFTDGARSLQKRSADSTSTHRYARYMIEFQGLLHLDINALVSSFVHSGVSFEFDTSGVKTDWSSGIMLIPAARVFLRMTTISRETAKPC